MKRILIIAIILITALLQSCASRLDNEGDFVSGTLNVQIKTKALELNGASVQKVRIIAYHKGENKIILNKTNLTDESAVAGEGLFNISIPTGSYYIYAIINEPANLTTTLDDTHTEAALDAIKINPETPFTESNVMLAKKQEVLIGIDNSGNTTIDGTTTKQLNILLDRVYTKVSLKINKQTVNPNDTFTIKKVEFVQSPAYSFLSLIPYDGTTFVSREMFDGSLDFTTNSEEKVIIKEKTVGTDVEPSNIFAEYLLSDADKSNHDKAAYFGIYATYTSSGTSPQDVYYKIPVGDYNGNNAVDGANHDYTLKRNFHYALNVKITKPGSKDAVEISYSVEPWKNESLDVEIDGDPFLDVSNVEVDVHDAAATRVYFYSNMPTVELAPTLLNGTQTELVNNLFENLTGMGAKNFTYTYNASTQRGEGYFDLINIYSDNATITKRLLQLKSGKLVREITATTRISSEIAKNNAQPYVGTFHRATERSERLVTWNLPVSTQWKVEIVTDNTIDQLVAGAQYYTHAKDLRIDRLASPNHANLYTLDVPSAEGAYITNKETKLEGRDRIYFRVGWANTIGLTSHRFAKIKITTTSTGDFSTGEVSYLYCRQGEEPKPILSNTTVFSCYNISTPGNFVDYPTKSGYTYQWNRTTPWAITGVANGYPNGAETDPTVNNGYEYKEYDPDTYICPSKYSYPDNNAIEAMQGALNPANVMYRWGYYADGYFDRRAVSEHIAKGVSGDIASAGGLFFSENTAVAIFLPTASWRDYKGDINTTTHQQLGVIGHYWSIAQENEWNPTTRARAVTPQLNAWALHLTTQASPDSKLEKFNKASAASVRCMKLEGMTIYFDANGGETTPRSVTLKSGGTVTFPDGPIHKDKLYQFTKWADSRPGNGITKNAGDTDLIENVGEKTWYAQYKKVGYLVNGKAIILSDIFNEMSRANAAAHCANTAINKQTGWYLPGIDLMSGLFDLDKKTFPGKIGSTSNLNGYWSNSADGTSGSYWFLSEWNGSTNNYKDYAPQNNLKKFRCVQDL